MRNGVMMAEQSPSKLLELHNANMLEDVVLKYCLKDEGPQTGSDPEPKDGVPQTGSAPESIETCNPVMYRQDDRTEDSETHSIHRIGALIIKNVIVLMRNIG